MNIITEIKKVLSVQSASIKKLLPYINTSFKKAALSIYNCRGKIIVTGIGKSGLVAQKISSTFSSTGTPAIYLHPSEGMHGNLGIVGKNDIVLAIGKSGESEEILNIIPSIKKIGAKIISITSNQNSSLAKLSSIVLYTPVKKEVCPLNLAPTTSSTVHLVVGDALAIVLMKLKGFGAESFALYHPGGILGRKLLLRVSDIMRSGRANPLVKIDDSIQKLLLEITKKWTGAASVIDKKGKLIGLVTDFDIRKAFARQKSIHKIKIKDILNRHPTTIFPHDMAIKALSIMESRKKPFTVLPVIDRNRKAIGMVHLHDLVTRGLLSNPK